MEQVNLRKDWANHISSFENKDSKQECALKDFICKLKEKKIKLNIHLFIPVKGPKQFGQPFPLLNLGNAQKKSVFLGLFEKF